MPIKMTVTALTSTSYKQTFSLMAKLLNQSGFSTALSRHLPGSRCECAWPGCCR